MFKRKGQNVAEYSILIALVVGAAVAMQVYVKRGLQARVKDAVDYTGNTTASGLTFKTKQYEPYYQDSKMDVNSQRSYQDKVAADGALDRSAISETTTRQASSYETTTSPSTQPAND